MCRIWVNAEVPIQKVCSTSFVQLFLQVEMLNTHIIIPIRGVIESMRHFRVTIGTKNDYD